MTHRNRRVGIRTLIVLACALLSSAAWAQQASGIAGVVKDTSGAVPLGVTVEAASPALIEKVRSAVTDGEGRYNITDLRPGTYVVTFSQVGFRTIRRVGIELPPGFTAPVNIQMQVGDQGDTITVDDATPVVDTQTVRLQEVVSSGRVADLPTDARAVQTVGGLIPGMSGTAGYAGLYRSNGPRASSYHGKYGVKVLYDGMNTLSSGGTGASNGYAVNSAFAEATTLETGGISAESNTNGILMNMVPRTGSNVYSLNAYGLITNDRLQSDNLSDDVRERGLTHTNEVLHLYDGNVAVGGPIKQNRLWFYAAGRTAGNKNSVAGVFFNKTQGTPFYTPDLDRPSYRQEWLRSLGSRVTWQASQKHKVGVFADFQKFFNRGRGEFVSPEASGLAFNLSPQGLFQGTWSSVMSTNLLLEGGASFAMNRWPYPSPGDGFMRVNPDDISILELSTGFRYNAKSTFSNITDQFRFTERFAMSYSLGSHVIKAGVQLEEGINDQDVVVHGDVNYTFLGGVPNRITQFATPYLEKNRIKADLGIFAQDQWTLRRLTLNYGLRLDYLNGSVPAQQVPAGRFVPEVREFAPVHDVPAWSDLSPRFGMSYDLFGNGRTAVKVSMGRYLEMMGAGLASANNPVVTSVTRVNRTWNDANGNYVPDCDLTNFEQNAECGPINNRNFGQNNPNATRYADDVLRGFGARSFVWDFGTEVQHELRPGTSVTAGYYRNWTRNFRATDNLAVTPADYSPYCITAPVDPRLPGGGGYQVCGLYDVAPVKFGQVDNLVSRASQFYEKGSSINCMNPGSLDGIATKGSGVPCGASDFFGVSVSTRIRGMQFNGGIDTGRTEFDNCFVVDSPQQLLNCYVVTPFKAQTQIKMSGTFPLPRDFALSGTLQNVPGKSFEATYDAPNAIIAPSLGRNLAACGTRAVCTATATVPLIEPMTQFLPRRTQIDLRLTKVLKVGPKLGMRANLDLYNVLNSGALLGVNSTYGPTWQRPVSDNATGGVDPILPGRLIQVGGQIFF